MDADGSVVIRTDLDDKQAQAELNRLEKKINGLQERVQRAQAERIPWAEQAEELVVQLDAAKAKLYEMQNAAQGAYSSEQIADQKENVQSLQRRWNEAQGQVERYDRQIQKANADIAWNADRAGELSAQLAGVGDVGEETGERVAEAGEEAGDRVSSAMQNVGKRLDKLWRRISGLIKRVFFFSLITSALRGVRSWFSDVVKSNDEAAEAIGRFKGALLTLAQPLVQVVIPAVVSLVNVLTRVVAAVASLVSSLFGTTIENSAEAAKGFYEEQEAIKGVGGAAKKTAGQLAAFDTINKLAAEDAGGGGGSSGAITPIFDLPSPGELKILDGLQEWFDGLDLGPVTEAIGRLKESFGGLLDTLGEGFKWVLENVLGPLAKWTIEEAAPVVINLLSTALDFLRAVLEKLGPILNPIWENLLKPFFKWLGELTLDVLRELMDLLQDLTKLINGEISWAEFARGLSAVQWALLALGGIAVLNAIGKLVGAVAGIPGSIAKAIPKMKANIGKMAKTAAVGALAVFDAVMIAYDVVKLKEAADTYHEAQLAHNEETETALENYRKIYETKGKEVADEWAAMMYQIDTTNMSFDEAQAALTEKIATYWDGVPQNMWQGFQQGWDHYFGVNGVGIFKLLGDAFTGVVDWVKGILGIQSPSTVFYDIGADMVNGLINGFNAVWENFVSGLQTAWRGVTSWWSGLSLSAPKVETPTVPFWDSNLGQRTKAALQVPHLASGSVIPPNREFLAVLGDQKSGTNIEAPLDTIVAAFKQAMGEYGGGSFNFYLDGEPLYANVVKRSNQAARASGRG